LLREPVQAAGKKVGELQDELQRLYVPAFFKTLTVTVKYEERYFFVGGQVRNARQYPYLSQMTVLKAIQAAGDFTDFANRTKVQVTRTNGKTETVNCKKAQKNPKLDLPIYPGDRINVPQRIL
jgi:polysaccharide export outer membrane protein